MLADKASQQAGAEGGVGDRQAVPGLVDDVQSRPRGEVAQAGDDRQRNEGGSCGCLVVCRLLLAR